MLGFDDIQVGDEVWIIAERGTEDECVIWTRAEEQIAVGWQCRDEEHVIQIATRKNCVEVRREGYTEPTIVDQGDSQSPF